MHLPQCYCGRPIVGSKADYNRIEDNHCSTYCRRYQEEGYQNIPFSESKHNKNHRPKLPPIPDNCDYCGKEYNLRYELKESNREFCCLECYLTVRRGKKSHLHYSMLRILKHKGKQTAAEISRLMERNNFRMNNYRVALHMRLFVGRGVVIYGGEDTKTYELNTTLPIGKVIKDKVRVNAS